MNKSIREDYEKFAEWCLLQKDIVKQDKNKYFWTARSIANNLYDLRSIYSGYTSLEAIRKFNGRTTKMTREHYNGRAKCSNNILEMIINDCDMNSLVAYIKESCKVHYTTKEENIALAKYQNTEDYDWQKTYKDVGIKLVRYDGIKNWYKIEGIKYHKSKPELMELFGVSSYKLEKMIQDQGEELMIF